MIRKTATAVVLTALALTLTACGGSDAPARTDAPVIIGSTGSTAPTSTVPSTQPSATPAGQVDAPEVVAAVGQDRAQAAAETAERFAGVAMSNCGDAAATLAGLEDLLTPAAYQEAKSKPGGVVLEIQADLATPCVTGVDVTVDLTVDGPNVIAVVSVTQQMTALRDGVPAPLTVQRGYTLKMQPTAGEPGWVVTALTTTDPLITAAG